MQIALQICDALIHAHGQNVIHRDIKPVSYTHLDRQKLLGKIVGGDAFIAPHARLSKYGMVVDKYIRRTKGIDKYVIMPNHIHMIIIINSRVSGTIYDNGTMRASSPTQSIPQLVKSLKILITKEIGFSLFQRSYHDHIIRNEKEYKQIWEYIDKNPLKWERCV